MLSCDSEELTSEIEVERAHIINDGRENFIYASHGTALDHIAQTLL